MTENVLFSLGTALITFANAVRQGSLERRLIITVLFFDANSVRTFVRGGKLGRNLNDLFTLVRPMLLIQLK